MEELGIVLIILGIIALVLWIYAIYDILKGSLSGNVNKIIWLIVVIFFPILGALLYLIFGRGGSSSNRTHTGTNTRTGTGTGTGRKY